ATFARQHVGGPLTRANQAAEVSLRIAASLHAVADGVDRTGWFDRPRLALVILDHERQQIKSVGCRRARFGRLVKVALNFSKGHIVVSLAAKRADYRLGRTSFRHDTVPGSMRSYSGWVPMNLISTR